MPNASSLIATATPKFLIVGDGGTRKTRFLASCPEPFVLDFDNGMTSTAGQDVAYLTFKDAPWMQPKPGMKAENMPGVNKAMGIYPWGESFPRFIDFLNETIWPSIERGDFTIPFEGGHRKIGTLGADSLTTMATQSMNYVLKGDGKNGKDQPQIQHWGTQLRLLETVMEQLCAWPIRLVVTAHIKRDDNLIMGTKEFLPLVAGQLSGKIGVYFDECYYTEASGKGAEMKVKFVTETNALYRQAKSRMNVPSGTEATWQAVSAALARKAPPAKPAGISIT